MTSAMSTASPRRPERGAVGDTGEPGGARHGGRRAASEHGRAGHTGSDRVDPEAEVPHSAAATFTSMESAAFDAQ